MRVSVIIVNFNGAPFVYDCLAGLERQSFKDFEVLVVDNGSTDGSLEKIRARFPSARIIELGENKGWASGCVRGWKESKGQDIALLNNDAVPEPDWLQEMVAGLDSDPSAGMIDCTVINKRTGRIESCGLYPVRYGFVHQLKTGAEQGYPEIFGVSGVAPLFRGIMLKEVGFFCEDFVMYYEEPDLAYRARRAGWKTLCCPRVRVFHLGSETARKMRIRNYYLSRNRLRTIVRNWDLRLILKNLPWLVFYDFLAFWNGIFFRDRASLKARIDFLGFLPKDLKARQQIFAKTKPEFNLEKWLCKEGPGIMELWRRRR